MRVRYTPRRWARGSVMATAINTKKLCTAPALPKVLSLGPDHLHDEFPILGSVDVEVVL